MKQITEASFSENIVNACLPCCNYRFSCLQIANVREREYENCKKNFTKSDKCKHSCCLFTFVWDMRTNYRANEI